MARLLRCLIIVVAVILLAASQEGAAAATPRLCFLAFDPGSVAAPGRFKPFFDALRERGYAEGSTLAVDYLSADSRNDAFPALARECLRRNADVIVVATTPAADAAKQATSTVPILLLFLGDPVGTGLVESVARPGGNITGTSFMAPEMAAKRLQLLKETVPTLSRVLVLSYLADPLAQLQVTALKAAAHEIGLTLLVHDIRDADDIAAAFRSGAKAGANGLVVTSESIFFVQRTLVTKLAATYRLPAIYPFSVHDIADGGLMSYGADGDDLQRWAADYAARIFNGAKPADLPIQQPTLFNLTINLKTAKALGITVPRSILSRADDVFE